MMSNTQTANKLTIGLLGLIVAACFTWGCASVLDSLPDKNSKEAQVFLSQCSACHAPPHPKRHYAEQWPGMVSLMENHMSQRGMLPLQTQQREDILQYLTRHAR